MAIFKVFVGTDWIIIVFGLLGFGIQGGFVGLYAVSARIYPTEFRTTGVGWSIGIGRLGGIIYQQRWWCFNWIRIIYEHQLSNFCDSNPCRTYDLVFVY
jgi:hypothetical protein